MAVFKIALVNNAQHDNDEHWDRSVSARRPRAIKRARRLRSAGNRNIMLFEQMADGNWKPVSLSQEVALNAYKHTSIARDPVHISKIEIVEIEEVL